MRGYLPADGPSPVEAVRRAWRRLTPRPCPPLRGPRPAPDDDWVARTRAAAGPTEIAPRLWVAPPWADPPQGAPPEATVVRIVPGAGFGTGSHPTTRSLLRWLAGEPGFGSALDVGTGSGVLAIAAAALGARLAVGLEVDLDAVANAAANRARNPAGARVGLVAGSLEALAAGARFDRVLANLDGDLLARLVPDLAARCAAGGRLGAAGLLARERAGFLARAEEAGLRLVAEEVSAAEAAGERWWSGWFAPTG